MFRIAIPLVICVAPATHVAAQEVKFPEGAHSRGFLAASAAVNAFVRAMRAEDLDALMETVDVPWFLDGKKIVESKDELRAFLRKPLKQKDFSDLKVEFVKVQTFGSLKDKASGQTGELLKRIARDDDLFFQLNIKVGERSDKLYLLVRVDGGKGKVIGLRD
jgi:hypothetical protein